jgi:hypothetical protein
MELRIPDEPGRIKSCPEKFILHDLQFVELRVRHVSPHHEAVRHGGSDNLSVDCDFVLDGQLASPTNQRIKLSTNDESASFRVLDLGNESEMIVELNTEVFDDGCPGDDAVEHSDFADRSEMTLGKKNGAAFFRIHVDSPSAKP